MFHPTVTSPTRGGQPPSQGLFATYGARQGVESRFVFRFPGSRPGSGCIPQSAPTGQHIPAPNAHPRSMRLHGTHGPFPCLRRVGGGVWKSGPPNMLLFESSLENTKQQHLHHDNSPDLCECIVRGSLMCTGPSSKA